MTARLLSNFRYSFEKAKIRDRNQPAALYDVWYDMSDISFPYE
jgi:hypothetical protein